MTRSGGMFLGGAKSRLLPASVPFRYFGSAVVFHLLAWLALLAGADSLPRFRGGLGWPLAALHLTTLGVLVMSAIGASLQLLPVASRQPVRSTRLAVAIWWLFTPGVALLASGMAWVLPFALATGAALVVLALLGYAALLATNLRGARGMPGVIAYGWSALGCLALVLLTALSLAFTYVGVPLIDRHTALVLHLAFAAYGFMGLLAFGMSCILVPMFALSPLPAERSMLTSCALAVAALLLAGLAAIQAAPSGTLVATTTSLLVGAIGLGLAGTGLHLHAMRQALRVGMRRELGQSFTLVRIGWSMLLASLVLALLMVLAAPVRGMVGGLISGLIDASATVSSANASASSASLDALLERLPALFALVLIGGWLLTFLLGILRRILPFLGSMHVPARGRRAPTPSSLSAERPLVIHYRCHLGALAALAVAILTDNGSIATIGAVIGSIGAIAFAVFFAILLQRMRR